MNGSNFTEMLLNKRARQAALDQEADQFKQRQQQQYMQQFSGALASAGGMLNSLQQSGKQDAIANSLMNKGDAPRAEAVDPSAPGIAEANAMYGGPTEPHSGGMKELKLNMAMDQNRRANLGMALSQQRLSILGDRKQISDAAASSRLVNQKDKDVFNASTSYFKNLGVYQKAIGSSIQNGDLNGYQAAAQNIQGIYHAAKAIGLDSIEQPMIPDFQAAVPESTTGGIFGFGATKVPAKPAISAPAWSGMGSTSKLRSPSQQSIDHLLSNPSLADQFDATYGAGSSDTYLNQ